MKHPKQRIAVLFITAHPPGNRVVQSLHCPDWEHEVFQSFMKNNQYHGVWITNPQ